MVGNPEDRFFLDEAHLSEQRERQIFLASPTRFSAIFTRSGYFCLARGGVRRPRAICQDVVYGCRTEHFLFENVVISA